MKILVILFLVFNFSGINGDEQSCESKCLNDDQSSNCNSWKKEDGVDKRTPNTVYQYDRNSQKCKKLSCKNDKLEELFASESKCLESCGNCGRILKHYKFDDECLKPPTMGYGFQMQNGKRVESSKESDELKVYSFDLDDGECGLKNIYGHNWYVKSGVGPPTLEECNKRCPPVK